MTRIAIDARDIKSLNGKYIVKLLDHLQRIDRLNEYVILLRPEEIRHWQPVNKNFKKVVSPFKAYSPEEQTTFKAQLEKLHPDLVHFTTTHQPVNYEGRVITTVHDLTVARFNNQAQNRLAFASKKRRMKRFVTKTVKNSQFVIAPSKFVKQDVATFCKIEPNKIFVINEGVDEILVASEPLRKIQSKSFLLYVGSFQRHKNLTILFKVLAMLRKDNPSLYLVLAGRKDDNVERLMHDAKRYGVDGFIIFTGYVSEGQLKWLYRSCRAYICPGLSDGFGLPGLEAMALRAPVASSTSASLPEIYGNAAWYFNPLDKYDMERSIKAVLEDKELRNRLIRAGRDRVQKYSWEKMAKETLKVYEAALRK